MKLNLKKVRRALNKLQASLFTAKAKDDALDLVLIDIECNVREYLTKRSK